MRQSIVLCIFFVISHSAKLPSNFMKCHRKDPDFHECCLKAATDALSKMDRDYPEVNLPNLEPFVLPEINVTTNSRNVQTTQHLKDTKYYGFTGVKPTKFEWDFDKKTMILEGVFPEIILEGQYQIDGKILVLNLKGEGTRRVVLKNLEAKIRLNYEEIKRKGKTHMKFVSGELKLKPENMHIQYDNLFNDKALSDNINNSLNENWEAVWEGVESDTTETVLKIFLNLANGFFTKVSMEEAFD